MRTRSDVRLPEAPFVRCSVNNREITPDTCDSWMGILSAIDASVL